MMYERIKVLCKQKGLSINSLEKELGTAKGYMSKIDSLKPSNDRICAIAKALGVSPDYLVTGEESDTYYLNDETKEIAQVIFENKELKMLFDVSRNAPADRLIAYYNLIKAMQDTEKGND